MRWSKPEAETGVREHVAATTARDGSRQRGISSSRSPKVVLLIADTGGGHRAVAEALRGEIMSRHGSDARVVIVDPFADPRTPAWARLLARGYGPVVRQLPMLWGLLFHLTNFPVASSLIRRASTRALRPTLRRTLAAEAPDVVVALHPLLVAPTVAVRGSRAAPRLITLITDTGRIHLTWWSRGIRDVVLARSDLRPPQRLAATAVIHAHGLPIRPCFSPGMDQRQARQALGLSPNRFIVLIAGGGEGVRAIEGWATALIRGPLDVDVVVICGRNEAARRRLNRISGRPGRSVVVKGFVNDMHTWMAAADVMVTKAGPTQVAEASAMGLPLLLAGHLPGQEAGIAEFAEDRGFGRRVTGRRSLTAHLRQLLDHPATVSRMRSSALHHAQPHATARTAELIAPLPHVPDEERTERRNERARNA